MPRHARKYYETPFFHVIVQGINKEYIFNETKYIERYLNIIKNKLEKSEIKIIAYCIMNNHAHFLIYTKEIEEMSKFMLAINTIFARYYNKEKDRVGYVFKDRYISEPITSENYLIKCINYIHNNPVKANIVAKCSDYKYSSYNNFMKDETIKYISEIININLDTSLFVCPQDTDNFVDIDINKDKIILKHINEFRKAKNIELAQIYENRTILKELIKYLKFECSIKYTEIMKFMDIPRGVIKCLKMR